MDFIRKLPVPLEIKQKYPISEDLIKLKAKRDKEISDVFTNKSDKFILIIGPCSADREDSVVDYVSRLIDVQEQVKDKILIIPRIYTNKPRTKGLGYKGMLHQPNPLQEEDLLAGIIAIRKMHLKVISETGFTCADEMLYPSNHRYISDLLSYVAVGARSVENQEHRLVSSGLDIPVGMKNPTSGDLSVMMNSLTAAQNPQKFIYRGWEVKTSGNNLTHCVLRGYVDRFGRSHSNYHYENLETLVDLYSQNPNLKNPAVIIDTNHNNSGKRFEEQIRIAKDVMHSKRCNSNINTIVKGLMIESYIEDGCQNIDGNIYGKSITDPCLGWNKSEKLIYDLAELLL